MNRGIAGSSSSAIRRPFGEHRDLVRAPSGRARARATAATSSRRRGGSSGRSRRAPPRRRRSTPSRRRGRPAPARTAPRVPPSPRGRHRRGLAAAGRPRRGYRGRSGSSPPTRRTRRSGPDGGELLAPDGLEDPGPADGGGQLVEPRVAIVAGDAVTFRDLSFPGQSTLGSMQRQDTSRDRPSHHTAGPASSCCSLGG